MNYYFKLLFCSLIILILNIESSFGQKEIQEELETTLKENLLQTWYPEAIDLDSGGYFSDFTYDFKIKESKQDKMIVTQARHLWSNSKAVQMYPEESHYLTGAKHAFVFLSEKMWDKKHGGFFQLVDRSGQPLLEDSPYKTAYGNSFAIYSLAAYFASTQDSAGLDLAIKAFNWLEEYSHDPEHKGYFQHLSQEGSPIQREKDTPSTSDLGYKDQNSSIHLLEAFTELYQVWKDPLLRERLEEMLYLVRDTMVHADGYLQLFFEPDWTPISFRDRSEEVILQHRSLDHVSFGHDIETAFLLIESSHTLGLENDTTTLAIAKKLATHTLDYGWDQSVGGFYDEGYYFNGESKPRIIKDTKNWWAQAEGLNSLLVMSTLFPDNPYAFYKKFEMQWEYINANLIDYTHGDWYAGGLDKQPEMKKADKGHMWKGNYHQVRALKHSIDVLDKKGINN